MAGAEVQEIRCKTLLNRIDVPSFPFGGPLTPTGAAGTPAATVTPGPPTSFGAWTRGGILSSGCSPR